MKPYIILSLIPGALLWLNNAYLQKVASKFIRSMLMPFLGVGIFAGGLILYQNMGDLMGNYGNVEKTMEMAQKIQKTFQFQKTLYIET